MPTPLHTSRASERDHVVTEQGLRYHVPDRATCERYIASLTRQSRHPNCTVADFRRVMSARDAMLDRWSELDTPDDEAQAL